MSEINSGLLEEMKQAVKDNAYDNEALSNALNHFKLDDLRKLGKEYCGLRVNTATKKKTIEMIVDFIELYRGLSVRERDLYLMRGGELRLICKRLKIPQDMFDNFRNREPVANYIIEVEKEKNCTAPLPRSRDGFMEKYWRIRNFLAEVLGEPVAPAGNDAVQSQEHLEETSPINDIDDSPLETEQTVVIPALATSAGTASVEPAVSTTDGVSVVSQNPPTDNISPSPAVEADDKPHTIPSQLINQTAFTNKQSQPVQQSESNNTDDEIDRIIRAVERGEAISFDDLQTYSKYQNSLASPAGETVPDTASVENAVPPVTKQSNNEVEEKNISDAMDQPSQINTDDEEYEEPMQHAAPIERERSTDTNIEATPEAILSRVDAAVPTSDIKQTPNGETNTMEHPAVEQIETAGNTENIIVPSPDIAFNANTIDVVGIYNNIEGNNTDVDVESDAIDVPAFNELLDIINSFNNDIEVELSIQEDLVGQNKPSDSTIDVVEHNDDGEGSAVPPTVATAKKLADAIDARLRKAQLNLEKRIDYIKRSFAAEMEEISNTELRVGDAFNEQINQAKQTGNTMLDGVRNELETHILDYRNAVVTTPTDSVNDVTGGNDNTGDNTKLDASVETKTVNTATGATPPQGGDTSNGTPDVVIGAVSKGFVPFLSDSESPIHARIAFAKARVESELAKLSQPSTDDIHDADNVKNRDDVVTEASRVNFVSEDEIPTEEQSISVGEQYTHNVFDFDNKVADELVAESEALASVPEYYDQQLYDEAHNKAETSDTTQQEVSFWNHLMQEGIDDIPGTMPYNEVDSVDINDDIRAGIYSNDGVNTALMTMDDINDVGVDHNNINAANISNDMKEMNQGDKDTTIIPTIPLDELQELGELFIDNDMEIEETAFMPSSTSRSNSTFNFDNGNPFGESTEEPTNFIGNYEHYINDTLDGNIDVTLSTEPNSDNITINQPSKTGGWIAGTRNTGTGGNKPRSKSLRINRQTMQDISYTSPQPAVTNYIWDNAEYLIPDSDHPTR